MPDHMTPQQRSRAMSRVKLRNGPLEKLVQRKLRIMGVRYRCNSRGLSGSPDLVLPQHNVVIFVDGNFWHGWRLPLWEHKLSTFWREKLRANRARDQRNFRRLRRLGWTVCRIWEHQARDPKRLADILKTAVRRKRIKPRTATSVG
jgi:DNA mismatch endonuclease (patch repair protein)